MNAFWKLECPAYPGGDYRHTFINGKLEHPYTLPGVNCELCQAHLGNWRVVPFECPAAMRRSKFLRDYDDDISMARFRKLAERLADTLAKSGISGAEFFPGARLHPCILDIPSRPTADFLGPGMGSVVISARIKETLEPLDLRGVAYCPVRMRTVGNRSPRQPYCIPPTGEPEDLVERLAKKDTAPFVGAYFELVILDEFPDPPGVELCGSWFCEEREHSRRMDKSWRHAWQNLKSRTVKRLVAGREMVRAGGGVVHLHAEH